MIRTLNAILSFGLVVMFCACGAPSPQGNVSELPEATSDRAVSPAYPIVAEPPAAEQVVDETPAIPSPTIRYLGNKTDAIIGARDIIRREFNADVSFSTFGFDTAANYRTDLEAWDVTGEVTGKNGFGVEVTEKFWVITELAGDSWQGVRLKIGSTLHYDMTEVKRAAVSSRRQRELEADPAYQAATEAARQQRIEELAEAQKVRDEQAAQEKRDRRRKSGASRVAMTKDLLRTDKADSLQTQWMLEVIEDHPDTELATEAAELLKKLPPLPEPEAND